MKDGQANLPTKVHFPTFLIEPILELVRAGERHGIAEGYQVKLAKSKRLNVFAHHGTTCVRCGLKATHFELKTATGTDVPHLNLMAGKVIMTMDHIRPKRTGGGNELSNLQPMCSPCNAQKGGGDSDIETLRAMLGRAGVQYTIHKYTVTVDCGYLSSVFDFNDYGQLKTVDAYD